MSEQNQQGKRAAHWTSPWEEFSDAIEAESLACNDRRNELGIIFRSAQQEAINGWLAWDASMDAKQE